MPSTLIQTRGTPPPIAPPFDEATEAQKALPYDRSPAYYGLSPHALSVYRDNPVAFYFRYCAPKWMRWPDIRQTAPMAVGQGVDSLAKNCLIREGWRRNRRSTFRTRHNRRSFSIFGEVAQWNRTAVVRKRIRQVWEGLRGTSIWSDAVCHMDTVDLESSLRDPTWVHGVPLNGKLDFLFHKDLDIKPDVVFPGSVKIGDDGRAIQRIVADMKINGALSPSGSSPTPGYKKRVDYDPYTKEYEEKGPHKRCGEPLEALHHQFATQLATYCLMEDAREQGTPTPDIDSDDRVMLFQATFGNPTKEPKVRKTGPDAGTARPWKYRQGRISYTLIDTVVTHEFKRQTLRDYAAVWESVRAKTLVPAHLAPLGETFLYMMQARHRWTEPV